MKTTDLALIVFAPFVVGCRRPPPALPSQSQAATTDAEPTSEASGKKVGKSGDSGGRSPAKGSLPPHLIQQVVRDNFGPMRTCYEDGLRGNPSLAGKITTKFVIQPDGHVSSAVEIHDAAAPGPVGNETAESTRESRFPDSAVVDCVVSKFAAMTFPPPQAGSVTVVYPIIFRPAE